MIEAAYIPEFKRQLPAFPAVNKSLTECANQPKTVLKTLFVLNTVKYKYCYEIYQNMLSLSNT